MSEIYIVDRSYSSQGHTLVVGDYPELDSHLEETGAHKKDPPLYEIWIRGGRKLVSTEMPSNYYLHSRKKSFADAFRITNGIIVVSERMKNLIEGLDANKHQFFPINIFYRNGDELSERYFTMHVTVSKPTISMNQSAVEFRSYKGIEYTHFTEPGIGSDPVIINDEIAEDAHFWRDDFSKGTYFVSKTLLDEVKERKLIFFRTYPTLEASARPSNRALLPEKEEVPTKKLGFFQRLKLFK